MNNLNQYLQDNIIKNPLIHPYNKPKLNNIIIEFNYNEVIKDKLALIPVYKTLMLITGQKPKIIKSKDSIAAFKVRKNMEIGAMVTLRGQNLNNFLKLFLLNLPKFKISNFNVSCKSFDFFYPIDHRTGANIVLNISSSNKEVKNFFLSHLLLFK